MSMGGRVDSPGGMGMPPPTSTPSPLDEGMPPAIGPDGAPMLDDVSQHSTLSNTSQGESYTLLLQGSYGQE